MATPTEIIIATAQRLGVDPILALASAKVESGFNPKAVGDYGTSFGLYQLHEGGELGNLTPQQAFDPSTNAAVALQQFKNVQRSYPNVTDPGQIAALAQRPEDPQGYAVKVDQAYASLQQKKSNGGLLGAVGDALQIEGGPAAGIGEGIKAGQSAAGAIDSAAGAIDSAAGFFRWITDSHNWLRLGEILAGATLMVIGVVAVGFTLGDKDIVKAAGSVATSLTPGVGEVKSAKRLSKTGKAPIE